MTSEKPQYYPGEDLGLPANGMGSIAGFGPRIAAIVIDWIPGMILGAAFFNGNPWSHMIVFMIINIIFIPTLGGTPGHRIVGMRVLRADGAWTGMLRPIARTICLALVIPVAIWDQDNRGLHDKVAGTILVRSPSIFRPAA